MDAQGIGGCRAANNPDRVVGKLAGLFGWAQHHRRCAVGHRAGVEQANRISHHVAAQEFFSGNWFLKSGIGIAGAIGVRIDGEVGKLNFMTAS